MKSDKEYPATHSMSTDWFAIDKDGKVAIFSFEDNGPVPNSVEEHSADYLIYEGFYFNEEKGIYNLNYTKEQAEELEKSLKPVDDYTNLYSLTVVKIDPARTSEFIKVCETQNLHEDRPYTVISARAGLYIVDIRCDGKHAWNMAELKRLIDSGVIQKLSELYIDFDDEWNNTKNKWEFTPHAEGFPYYIYQQPYDTGQLIERTYTPRYPLTENQLSENIRKYALRLPLSFDKTDTMQIAEYFPFGVHYDSEYIGERGIRVFEEYNLPVSDGSKANIRNSLFDSPNCNLCKKCKLPDHTGYKIFDVTQYSADPTIILLYAPQDAAQRTEKLLSYSLKGEKRDIILHLIQVPLIPGVPRLDVPFWDSGAVENDILNQPIADWFANCRDIFEESIAMLKPRVILATNAAIGLLAGQFAIDGNMITIGNTSYEIYDFEDAKLPLGHILELARLPYIGVKPQIVTPDNSSNDKDDGH